MNKNKRKFIPLQIPLFDPMVIELSKDHQTLISPEDADLYRYRWEIHKGETGRIYVRRPVKQNGKRQWIWMHRVVLERKIGRVLNDHEVADHINNDPLDNRRENLRISSISNNVINTQKSGSKYTSLRGAHYNKRDKVWNASISINGKSIHLGSFKTAEQAHEAYKNALHKSRGEFSPY